MLLVICVLLTRFLFHFNNINFIHSVTHSLIIILILYLLGQADHYCSFCWCGSALTNTNFMHTLLDSQAEGDSVEEQHFKLNWHMVTTGLKQATWPIGITVVKDDTFSIIQHHATYTSFIYLLTYSFNPLLMFQCRSCSPLDFISLELCLEPSFVVLYWV